MAIMSPGMLKFLQKLEGKGRKWDEKGLQEKKHISCKVSDFPKSASFKYTKNSNHILERRSKFMVQSLAALRRPNQLTFTEKEELNLNFEFFETTHFTLNLWSVLLPLTLKH